MEKMAFQWALRGAFTTREAERNIFHKIALIRDRYLQEAAEGSDH